MKPDTGGTDDDNSGLSRRDFVAAGAAGWASVAVAGCSALSPGDGNGQAQTTTQTGANGPEPQNFVVTDELITGSEFVPEGFDGFVSSCSPSRTFAPGMQPVFKIGVFDPDTGEQLGTDDLESVTVNVDGGPNVDLSWGGDDEENPAEEWSGNWVIPEDTEPGTKTYTVEVTDGDAQFRNVGILESSFQVIEYEDPRNYVVTDDLYTGSAAVPENNPFISACGPSRQFAPGMMVGFDIGIYDGSTGNPVGPTDFEYEGVVPGIESATLTIEGRGVEKELAWQGGGGENTEMGEDLFWNATWFIPEDAEPGTVNFTIQVRSEVQSKVVGALANQFTIVER
jgi:hypothetical protein